jgi:hypothetical protein
MTQALEFATELFRSTKHGAYRISSTVLFAVLSMVIFVVKQVEYLRNYVHRADDLLRKVASICLGRTTLTAWILAFLADVRSKGSLVDSAL